MGQRIMFWSTHTYIKIQNQTHPLHIKMLQCSKWSSRFNWPWKDLRAAVLQVVGGARVWVLKDDCLILSVNVQDVANHGFWVISLDHFRHCIFFDIQFWPILYDALQQLTAFVASLGRGGAVALRMRRWLYKIWDYLLPQGAQHGAHL